MSVLQEIYKWTKELRPWQSDALSRLLTKKALTHEDHDDLYALLKADQGIPDPKNRLPHELIADLIPAPIKSGADIRILAIKNLTGVNALAENHRLPIGPTGLTVIYGDNGSGKSGYTRVLKRACRARDQSEPILPDARKQSAPTLASAVFETSISGTLKDECWTDSKTAPAALSSIAIFDSRCARLYLDKEDDYSYVPYGLDVFHSLAIAFQQLKKTLDAEILQSTPDLSAFAHLQGPTEVGKLIAGLSAKTTTAQIDALGTITPEESAQHERIAKSLKETNAKEKAARLRTQGARITTLATNCEIKEKLVAPMVYSNFKALSENYAAAKIAAALAAKQFCEGENLLPGSGAEPWRELFEAARRFAVVSHPEHNFPDLGPDSRCPLCQQPLSDGATRLKKFEVFISQDAEETSRQRRTALSEAYRKLMSESLSINFDEATYGEIEAIDKSLADDTRAFENALNSRKEIILAAITTEAWGDIPAELGNPAERLRQLAEKISLEVLALEKAADEKAREFLQVQHDEFEARLKLSYVRAAVIVAAERLALLSKLRKCEPALRTNAISTKAAQVSEKIVSAELAHALNKEFQHLGAGDLQVTLQSRVDKGKTLHKLKIELPQSRSPAEILSEGEQRAIAIGSFLAEVNVSGGGGAIVFDDPVSSLDHARREYVANRLVSEGVHRQVIIFTHDIYFLCLLLEVASNRGVPILSQSLARTPEGFGVSGSELPFEGRSTTKRIEDLRKQCQVIRKLSQAGDIKECRRQTREAYVELRMSWERALEEVLFGKVVVRFRKSIMTDRLAGVLVDESDYPEVEAGMTRCSNYAHDKAMDGGSAMPTADELLSDVNTLEKWRGAVVARSKALIKKRDGAISTPLAAKAG